MNLATNLLDEFAVPLEIISQGDEIRGRIRLQKLIFLSQISLKGKYNYEFEPAPLGPLSDYVNYLLKRMIELGVVEEIIKSTPSGNNVYCYKITNVGKKILDYVKKSKVLNQQDAKEIDAVYKKFGKMSYVDLLDHVHNTYPQYHLKEIIL